MSHSRKINRAVSMGYEMYHCAGCHKSFVVPKGEQPYFGQDMISGEDYPLCPICEPEDEQPERPTDNNSLDFFLHRSSLCL